MTSDMDVSMLWESVDARSALRTRFGFASADHAAAWLADALQEARVGHLDRCHRIVLSAHNLLAWLRFDGREVVAKCCIDGTRFSRLAAVDALVAWLADRGLPVAAPIAALDGRLRVEHGRFSIGLYPVIDGDLLDAADTRHVEAAGRTLATLHQALSTYPHPFDGDGPVERNKQLVHGDFRSANILCDGSHIAAVVDFDEAGIRGRVTELGRSAVLLGTRYHDWAPTDPETRSAFIAAYTDVAPLSETEELELARTIEAVCNRFGWA